MIYICVNNWDSLYVNGNEDYNVCKKLYMWYMYM